MNDKLISLAMIVRDEADNLSRCLKSVVNIVDEIIIVDTGSKDATVEIAESFGARVFNFPWGEDFSAARNYSISKCSGNFILYLDADEALSLESADILRTTLEANLGKALICSIKNLSTCKERLNYGKYCRIFPNLPGVKFVGKAHEQIEDSLISKNIEIINSDIEIVHYGYADNEHKLKAKAERNLKLLKSDYDKFPNSYLAYQLALTYSLLGKRSDACNYFLTALSDDNLHKDYKYISYEFITNFHLQSKNYAEAKAFLEKLFEIDSTKPSAYLLASKIYASEKNYERALMFAASCYEFNSSFVKNKSGLVDVVLNKNEIIYHGLHLALLCSSHKYRDHFLKLMKFNGNKNGAELFEKIIRQDRLESDEIAKAINEEDEDKINVLILLLKNYIHRDVSISILEFLLERYGKNANLIINYADMLYKRGGKEEAILLLEESFEKFTDNPAPAFYLMSYYIENSEFHKLETPLVFLETHFANDKDVVEGLNQINQQIKIILN